LPDAQRRGRLSGRRLEPLLLYRRHRVVAGGDGKTVLEECGSSGGAPLGPEMAGPLRGTGS
jgi:hypothetical protein